jgi:hypothetical protein
MHQLPDETSSSLSTATSASSRSPFNNRPSKSVLSSTPTEVDGAESSDEEWILISNNILADGRDLEMLELQPAAWYRLLVAAQTDMGLTERQYLFSTLTSSGGETTLA